MNLRKDSGRTLFACLTLVPQMNAYQLILLSLLAVFYLGYFLKMQLLKKQGITGNLLAKGEKPHKTILIELGLRAVTLLGGIIQFGSVLLPGVLTPVFMGRGFSVTGVILAGLGCVCFLLSVTVMKNNWRAGFTHDMDTTLVTDGIYTISRNPAFLGFDLLYAGCALAFSNSLNLVAAAGAIALFHLQILQEEKYLTDAFGEPYRFYVGRVRRYFGKRQQSTASQR